MADLSSFENHDFKPKSFWKRPEGVTGAVFLAAIFGGLGYFLVANMATLVALAANTVYLVLMIVALIAIVYMVLDPKMRTLVSYMYKSIMRWITGIFVQIDPIGILKNYVEDLKDNLKKLSKQIGGLKGQMRKLTTLIGNNNTEIEKNMKLAVVAKKQDNQSQLVLASRKAARLKDSNEKYNVLHTKMEIMYRVLTKMYSNSEILLEDTKDQVQLKEQERKAIRASHSAMKSAMSILQGNSDKRAMFDAAMENIADDVSMKIGEMERFMDVSSNIMSTIDLQNGVFEEEGMAMLEKWEKESPLMLSEPKTTLNLNSIESKHALSNNQSDNSNYDNLFE